MGAVSDFVEQSKEINKKLSNVHAALNTLIDSFTPEESRQALVIALEEIFFKDVAHEDIRPVSADVTSKPQEICIELGREMGISETMIEDYLYPTCNLLPQEVSKIRVLGNKTFISIPKNRLQDCLHIMLKNPIAGKRYKVYLVEDIFHAKKPQRDKFERFGKKRGSGERRDYRMDRRGGKR